MLILVVLILSPNHHSWSMRLLTLAPWFAALITSAAATKPESVEQAGMYRFFHDLFRFVATCLVLQGSMTLRKGTSLMKRRCDGGNVLP